MNATNPKVSIFFLAFLPQFVHPEAGPVTLQVLTLSAIFLVCALLIFNMVAVFSGLVGRYLKQSALAQRILNRLAAVVFVGLAIKLATSSK